MLVTIEDVGNGFILEYPTDDDNNVHARMVFEETDEDKAQSNNFTRPGATQALLSALIDLLGESGSRYDARRIRVSIEPGDKFEDTGEELESSDDSGRFPVDTAEDRSGAV